MKKLILTAIIGICGIFAAQAQDIKFGVKGGLNVASLSDLNGSSKLSGHIGGFANFKFTNWAIQPEILFSGQGTNDVLNSDTKWALSYINIPVLFQYYFLPQFYAEAGPQMGFLLSAKSKNNGVSVDIKDAFKTVDIVSAIGVGYKFPIGVGVYARYNFGFTDLVDGTVDPRNSVFQLGASYTFGGK
ncbi:MAG TPA: porin family protein [Chitinophaga sp.]